MRGLRRSYPDAHLTYLVESAAAPLVRGNPHLDDVIVIPRTRGLRRITGDVALAARLRRLSFDVAIDLHGGPRSAWLAWATRAPMRIGYIIPGRTWMYTHRVPRTPEPSVRHSVLNQWDLLAPLGIHGPPDASEFPVEIAPDPASVAHAAERLAAIGAGEHDAVIVVHVSASNPFKRWPAGSFVDAIARLLDGHSNRYAIVVSGPSEPAAAEDVVRAVRFRLGDGGSRITSAQLDLDQLRALVSRAAVYIGGDSGPLHVAATTETPIVEILGPTMGSRSSPWRSPRFFAELIDAGPLPCRPCDERTCVPGDFRCLTQISPDRVAAAAERALAIAEHGAR